MDELPPLDSWLRSSASRPLLSAVARLWLQVTEAGYALGAYHTDALTFRLEWSGARGDLIAYAVVTDAPFASRLGQYHRPVPRQEEFFPFYRGLGCRVLPSAVEQGGVALPASEVQAFAIFLLDVFAEGHPPFSGLLRAEALSEMIPDFADRFARPRMATQLAGFLRSAEDTKPVISFIQSLASTE